MEVCSAISSGVFDVGRLGLGRGGALGSGGVPWARGSRIITYFRILYPSITETL